MRSRLFSCVLPSVATTLLSLTLNGCGLIGADGGQSIQPQLIRLASSGSPASIKNGASLASSGYAWSSNVNIAAFRVPIRGISLVGDGHSSDIYHCTANSNDGCLVDLAGPALQDLLGAATVNISAGTYTVINISTCEQEGSYHGFLTGSVSLGGTQYQTKSTGVLSAGGSPEPVSIEYSGCARNYPLPVPLVVSDTAGTPIAFRLYFDIRDLAWASLGETETAGGWSPGGCVGPRPGDASTGGVATPYVCTGYPDVAGVVDNAAPAIERYRINDAATFGLLFRTNGGEFIGGYTRRFFTEGVDAHLAFNADTPVEDFNLQTDGSYYFSSYGGGGPGGAPVDHYVVMPAFFRSSHTGIFTVQGAPFTYSAVKLP